MYRDTKLGRVLQELPLEPTIEIEPEPLEATIVLKKQSASSYLGGQPKNCSNLNILDILPTN